MLYNEIPMETTHNNTFISPAKNFQIQQSPFLTTPKAKKNKLLPKNITPKSIFPPNVNTKYNSLQNELKDSTLAFIETKKSTEQKIKHPKIKKTLILDLDETLVHSSFTPFVNPPDISLNIKLNGLNRTIYVLKRPYVDKFLEELSNHFEIIAFTASLSQYAGPLLDKLDKLNVISQRFYRENCIFQKGIYIKDLRKIGRELKNIIIIDNNPASYIMNMDNGIPIITWYDNLEDDQLIKLIPILKYLATVEDVRPFIRQIVNRKINKIDFNFANQIIKGDNNKKFPSNNIENKVLNYKKISNNISNSLSNMSYSEYVRNISQNNLIDKIKKKMSDKSQEERTMIKDKKNIENKEKNENSTINLKNNDNTNISFKINIDNSNINNNMNNNINNIGNSSFYYINNKNKIQDININNDKNKYSNNINKNNNSNKKNNMINNISHQKKNIILNIINHQTTNINKYILNMDTVNENSKAINIYHINENEYINKNENNNDKENLDFDKNERKDKTKDSLSNHNNLRTNNNINKIDNNNKIYFYNYFTKNINNNDNLRMNYLPRHKNFPEDNSGRLNKKNKLYHPYNSGAPHDSKNIKSLNNLKLININRNKDKYSTTLSNIVNNNENQSINNISFLNNITINGVNFINKMYLNIDNRNKISQIDNKKNVLKNEKKADNINNDRFKKYVKINKKSFEINKNRKNDLNLNRIENSIVINNDENKKGNSKSKNLAKKNKSQQNFKKINNNIFNRNILNEKRGYLKSYERESHNTKVFINNNKDIEFIFPEKKSMNENIIKYPTISPLPLFIEQANEIYDNNFKANSFVNYFAEQ